MSLITRGFGPNSAPVVAGFGPPPSVSLPVSGSKIFWPGRRSKMYDHLAESLYVKNYVIKANLSSVNGERIDHVKGSIMEGKNDERDVYSVKMTENVRVKKTNPENKIFINIVSFFKR